MSVGRTWLLAGLLVAGCGARSDLDGSDGDVPASALAPELIDSWYYGLASGAPRYFTLTICADGQAALVTSFLGALEPDPDTPVWGRVRPATGRVDAVASFPRGMLPPAFESMSLRYQRETDTLVWLEEIDVFPGWASGGGFRGHPDWIPEAEPGCR